MIWSELDFHPENRKLREFATVFFGAACILAAWQGFFKEHWLAGATLLSLGSIVLLAGLARPASIRLVYAGMMAASFPFGWMMSHLLLALVYFGLFTPLALFFRRRGRDPLGLKFTTEATTHWKSRPAPAGANRYLRPF